MNIKISVVISAYNEEQKIKKCLESVKWADEIIFIDNSSTDKTAEIAKKYTSKIFVQPNHSMLNTNKNFGFLKAKNEWILNLDSDEEVSEELKEEIKSILKGDTRENGFWIPRKNIIFGKWIKHSGWYPDHQLRLFRKTKGKFEEKHVHELLKLDGEVGTLKENIIHYNYETISQFLKKHFNIYANNEADELIRKGYEFNWLDSIRFPFNEFLSRFFAREGYRDGFHGLMLSMLMAFYHLVIFALIWEKNGFREVNDKNILIDTKKEFKKGHKDIMHWFLNEQTKQIRNPFKKAALKFQGKLH